MNEYLISEIKLFKDALHQLDKSKKKCLIVINKDYKLVGTLTDGDLRRALLRGNSLYTKIKNFVNKKPISLVIKNIKNIDQAIANKSKYILKKIGKENIDVIPIINSKKKFIKTISIKDFKKYEKSSFKLNNIPALIMAGGEGKRLKEFSKYFPKPLVPYENTTAIESIISRFKNYGVRKFYISVYYKKNLIKSYLDDNQYKNLTFLEEKQPLGTAGAIRFLKGKVKNDFFLINCDTILNIDLEKFYEFHKKNKFDLTLVAASKNFQLSYGACQIKQNGELKKIEEKPKLDYLVSVGLYLLKPEIIQKIPSTNLFNMNNLIEKVKNSGGRIGVFPISENSWIDTGYLRDIN
tara:strand:+ start:1021 stop:2073 length:1053 start_codon:yes stop_codon:yes gene_type:complete